MKVLHICTSDSGGAGIAAQRLHQGLLGLGIESKVLVLESSGKYFDGLNVIEQKLTLSRLYYKIICSINTRKKLKEINRLGDKNSYEIISLPFSPFRLEEHPLVKEADIINLHWVSGFVNYPTFFKYVKKPIVWTLHDMNPFLGGFHYLNDINRNKGFEYFDAELIKIKKKAYKSCTNLHIVTLSNYIKKYSEQSELLGNRPHYFIPNGYKPLLDSNLNTEVIKKLFGIDPNKKVILFVSESVNNYRKGFDLLGHAIRNIELPNDFLFVAIGRNKDRALFDNDKVKFLGELRDTLLLEMAYSISDYLFLPSREDNQPNTMMEALSLGIPVIAFAHTGMVDVITHEVNGVLLSEMTELAIKEVLMHIFNGKYRFDNNDIKSKTNFQYSIQKQAQSYINLYEIVFKQ